MTTHPAANARQDDLIVTGASEHNLQNVEVLGLPTYAEDALSSLLKEVTNRPLGSSFMVDELIMPNLEDHQEQITDELEQLQNHFEAQPAKPPLWIACAGMQVGKAEHFQRSYLTSILPPPFHLPYFWTQFVKIYEYLI